MLERDEKIFLSFSVHVVDSQTFRDYTGCCDVLYGLWFIDHCKL